MYRKIAIILCGILPQILTERCLTPNNEEAECIPLFSCPILISALASQHLISIKFVTESNCGGTVQNPMACCGTLSNYTTVMDSPTIQNKNDSKLRLLPSSQFCGYQHSDDYFRRDQDPAIRITEFPWLGLIKLTDPKLNKSYVCSGSLINRRYVLTAAHCIRNTYIVESVKLGEYNINNATDCIKETQFEEECSEPVREIAAEKVILYPKFSPRFKLHDIALIRLAKNVDYSDYIRPICLPLPGRTTAQVGDTLFSTGWGTDTLGGGNVEIKKKILSEMLSIETCKEKWRGRINITDTHLCSLPFDNNTIFECQGDSGGPLMFSYRSQWQQAGILSYGIVCDQTFSSVHTNVKKYLNWILENIEP